MSLGFDAIAPCPTSASTLQTMRARPKAFHSNFFKTSASVSGVPWTCWTWPYCPNHDLAMMFGAKLRPSWCLVADKCIQMSASSTKVGISHFGAKSPRYLAVQECHWIKFKYIFQSKAQRDRTSRRQARETAWKLETWFTMIHLGWEWVRWYVDWQLHLETSRYLKRH
jgi:hypothetical protein